MPGKYGPADVTLTLEDGPGGTARNLENFVIEGLRIKTTSNMTETTALGDAWEEHTPTGVRKTESISLTLIWDTTGTTGTHAVLTAVDDGPQDDGRALVAVFGDSKTYTVDVRLVSYEVIAVNDNIQTVVAELLPTGAGVWS